MTAPGTLSAAADLIEHYAAGTTEGPWAGHLSGEMGAVYGGPVENGYKTGNVMTWSEEALKEYGGEPNLEDFGWLCLMGPHLAAPLAHWLRTHAADECQGECPALAFAEAVLSS